MRRFSSMVVAVAVAIAISQSSCSKPSAPDDPSSAADQGPDLIAANDSPTTQPAAEPAASEPAASESAASESAAAEPAVPAAPVAVVPGEPEELMLGTAELTSSIPGSGPLTIDQITAWLADPKNHAVIQPLLPFGLAAGAGQIVGIDVNPLTRAKIELGRQLYFDPRLSGDGTISCASCHHPDFGYAKDTQFGVGVDGQTGDRNSPVAYNRILSGPQFWDGRAESLEAQAVGPIANPIEMANTHEACVATLEEVVGYRMQFEQIFSDGVTIDNVGRAIASFERALVTAATPWDYFEQLRNFERAFEADLEDIEALQEDDPDLYEEYMEIKTTSDAHPISESAIRGGELFFSDVGGCTACHAGANFSDELYHNLGVAMDVAEPDLGRFKTTNDEKDRGAFKTPTVRNVVMTAPYMHDGSQKTLEEVVEWYDKGGHPNPHLDEKIKPLKLTDQQKADLVAFMKSLTGELPPVEQHRLPE